MPETKLTIHGPAPLLDAHHLFITAKVFITAKAAEIVNSSPIQ
jgi:hypothetical protein